MNDLQQCDLLLVFGTSLEVFPVAGLVYQVPYQVPRVLFNKEVVHPFTGDHQTRSTDTTVCGDLVESVELLVQELEWTEEFNAIKTRKRIH